VPDVPIAVEVTRSGGFAGINLQAAVDTARLPPDQAAEVRLLVQRADPTTLDRRLAEAGVDTRSRDRFQYDIEIRTGDDIHRFSIGEEALPAELRALIDAVMSHGRDQ
jgi:hypothetical protein